MNGPEARRLLAVRVLLTVGTLAFFGPFARDVNESHLLNPAWVGHARVHVMWLMCFGLFSGMVNLYLIWSRDQTPPGRGPLQLAAAWQACTVLGFWAAGLSARSYGGITSVEGIHVHVLGIEESTAFFGAISMVLAAAIVLLIKRR